MLNHVLRNKIQPNWAKTQLSSDKLAFTADTLILLLIHTQTNTMTCSKIGANSAIPSDAKDSGTLYRGVNTALASKQDKETQNSSQTAFLLTATIRITTQATHKGPFLSVWPQAVTKMFHPTFDSSGVVKGKIRRRLQPLDGLWWRFVYTELASWLVR